MPVAMAQVISVHDKPRLLTRCTFTLGFLSPSPTSTGHRAETFQGMDACETIPITSPSESAMTWLPELPTTHLTLSLLLTYGPEDDRCHLLLDAACSPRVVGSFTSANLRPQTVLQYFLSNHHVGIG